MTSTWLVPTSLADALRRLADQPGLRPIAGGTDLLPATAAAAAWMRPVPAALLDLSRLPGLGGIEDRGDHHRIGAGVTWAALRHGPLPGWFDALRQAAATVGGVQVQHRATLLGNLCNASPAADGAPPLLALDAAVELASPRGIRHLPLAAFLLGNRVTARAADELATAVLVPKPRDAARSAFLKLGARRYQVISIVMVAGCVEVAQGRIVRARLAVGSCAPTALRLPALEAALEGVPPADAAAVVRAAPLASLAPIDDPRGSAEYRRAAAGVLLRRLVEQLTAPAPARAA